MMLGVRAHISSWLQCGFCINLNDFGHLTIFSLVEFFRTGVLVHDQSRWSCDWYCVGTMSSLHTLWDQEGCTATGTCDG